jgi:lysyl-tRNA synthetase class 2
MMHFVENLFEFLAITLYGTTKIPANIAGQAPGEAHTIEIDMKAPWLRLTMNESLKKYANIDVDLLNEEEMIELLKKSEHCDMKKISTMSRGLLIAALFGTFVEPHLVQPHHIIDHPIETTPLCKLHRHPEMKKQGIVERFETFILGQEICNSYSELNDPELQRKLLEIQAARKDAGDEEACPLDEEFLESICQGMPPTGGVGIGLDRLVMLFTNSHSIRDVLYFPWMKPQ